MNRMECCDLSLCCVGMSDVELNSKNVTNADPEMPHILGSGTFVIFCWSIVLRVDN